MKKYKLFIHAIFILSISFNADAQSPFTNNLTTCLVRATNEDDRKNLIDWILSIMSEHPNIRSINMSENDKLRADIRVADLFKDLLGRRCEKEFIEAMNYDGALAIESSFAVLGEIAMGDITGHPIVAEASGRFANYIDDDFYDALMEKLKN